MAWLCSYTPLEVLLAAGFTPARLTGHSAPVRKADSLMHPNLCAYVRSCLDTALEGTTGDLAGVVFVNSCDAMRRLYDAWRRYAGPTFTFIMDLPRGRSERDREYLRNEYAKLKTALETHFSTTVSDSALAEAAHTLAVSRSLWGRLAALREPAPPRLSGLKMMELAVQFFGSHPAEWNRRAEAVLSRVANEPPPAAAPKPRVILSGSPVHSPEIVGLIEDCGLDVVGEELCSGSRFFDVIVGDDGDPLSALARAYLDKPPCARMMMFGERVGKIISLARSFGAEGVVHHALKFCDTYLFDAPELKKRLAAAGLKTLFIEGDGTLGGLGQLKTRIEAFAEVLSSG